MVESESEDPINYIPFYSINIYWSLKSFCPIGPCTTIRLKGVRSLLLYILIELRVYSWVFLDDGMNRKLFLDSEIYLLLL